MKQAPGQMKTKEDAIKEFCKEFPISSQGMIGLDKFFSRVWEQAARETAKDILDSMSDAYCYEDFDDKDTGGTFWHLYEYNYDKLKNKYLPTFGKEKEGNE